MVELEKESLEEQAAFNTGCPNPLGFITGRDEFGLPIFSKTTGYAPKVFDGSTDKFGDKNANQNERASNVPLEPSVSGVKNCKGKEVLDAEKLFDERPSPTREFAKEVPRPDKRKAEESPPLKLENVKSWSTVVREQPATVS